MKLWVAIGMVFLIGTNLLRCSAKETALVEDTSCSGTSTCRSLANYVFLKELFRCSCQKHCSLYGDCCYDSPNNGTYETNLAISCVEVHGEDYMIYAISKCPKKWSNGLPSGQWLREKCEVKADEPREAILVYSNSTKKFYRNTFCAICNQDAKSVLPWRVHFKCLEDGPNDGVDKPLRAIKVDHLDRPVTYNSSNKRWQLSVNETSLHCSLNVEDFDYSSLVGQYKARVCRRAVETCLSSWSNEEVRFKCSAFTSYISQVNERKIVVKIFKNLYCALCNHVDPKSLSCSVFAQQAKASVSGFNGAVWGQKKPVLLSLSILFDMNFNQGSWVGRNERCFLSDGQYYNPVDGKCTYFYCGMKFRFDPNGHPHCVPIDDSKDGFTDTCLKIALEPESFILLDNGTLYVNKTDRMYSSNEFEVESAEGSDGNRVLVCYEGDLLYAPPFSVTYMVITQISLFVSRVCLILHLVVYAAVPGLRNLPGKCLMSLSASLLCANLAFVVSEHSEPNRRSAVCVLSALATHYFYLASFFWMNTIAFDACITFTSFANPFAAGKRNRAFLKYSAYAWFSPGLIVLISASCDLALTGSPFQPLYGHNMCWFSQRKALFIFFGAPVAIILLLNLVFFSLTAKSVFKTNKSAKSARTGSSEESGLLSLFLKLSLIMGLTWIFAYLASITGVQGLWYFFLALDGFQGAFIFIAFTLRKKTYTRLLQRMFGHKRNGWPSSSSNASTSVSKRTSSSVTLN